jgi:hypothetical protein
MTNRLHMTTSVSGSGVLQKAFPEEKVILLYDDLLEGPVEPFSEHDGLESWLAVRTEWWRARDYGNVLPPAPAGGPGFLEAFERIGNFDDVVVWTAETDAAQLFACWVAAAFERWGLDPTRLQRALAHRSRGYRVSSVGRLYPSQIVDVEIRPWTEREFATALRIWGAFVPSAPQQLEQVCKTVAQLESFSAIPTILERFPDANTGLSAWERRLLESLQKGTHQTVRHVSDVMVPGLEEAMAAARADSLFEMLLELSYPANDERLVRRWGSGASMVSTFFELTDTGDAVLSGEASRIQLMGLDRWVGGTHLDSRGGEIWCRTEEGLAAVEFPNAPADVARLVATPFADRENDSTGRVCVATGGARALAASFPGREIWALPNLLEPLHLRLSGLSSWLELSATSGRRMMSRLGIDVAANSDDESVEDEHEDIRGEGLTNLRRVDEVGLERFEHALGGAVAVEVWSQKNRSLPLLVGALGSALRGMGRAPQDIIELGFFQIAHPAEITATSTTRRPELVNDATDLWDAFVSGDSQQLNELADEGVEPGPASWLLDAIIGAYPSVDTGLSVSQEEALEHLETYGRRRGSEVWGFLKESAETGGAGALVRNAGDADRPSFELTDFGERVLAGEKNYVDVAGIDRYVGGMHLSSEEGRVWWRKDGRLVAQPDIDRATRSE